MKFLNKKCIMILIITILLLILAITKCYSVVSPTEEFYINDSAKVVNSKVKDYIIEMNKKLKEQTDAQIIVITVKSLEGMDISEYAMEALNNYRN